MTIFKVLQQISKAGPKFGRPIRPRSGPAGRSFGACVALILATFVSLVLMATPAMAEEFGLQSFAIGAQLTKEGTPDVQAGSHPYSLTTTFLLNLPTEGNLRDVKLELPPGFVGNPNATPHCGYQTFVKRECSGETVVGVAVTYVTNVTTPLEVNAISNPVFSLVAPTGVAAEFGYLAVGKVPVFLQTSVRTGADYGLTTIAPELAQAVNVAASKITIWGVPADPAHNLLRGSCLRSVSMHLAPVDEEGEGLREGEDEVEGPVGPYGGVNVETGAALIQPTKISEETGGCATQAPQVPLLTNPTSCGQPRTATLSVDDWEEPGNSEGSRTKSFTMPEISGCEKLDFSPTIGVTTDGSAGSTPTGLNVAVHVPQETTENPDGKAEADVKDTTVTLPAGMQLSPSAADGLQACSNAQIGFEGYKELDESGTQSAIFSPNAPSCPDASKVANVKIKTPLLEGELEGSVYLAAPQNFAGLPENPFGSLVAMYLVAEEPKAGVLIKVAGRVELGEPGVANGLAPGQIRTSFENTPQLPYSDLKLEFYGTDRAPLATPAQCGSYGTEASFTPWSSNTSVGVSSKPFEITSGPVLETASGPQATPCPGGPLPFSPSLTSGTTNNNAGGFSNLATTFSREDGQQSLSGITLHYPPGLSGILAGIPLCGEAQANAGTCSSASEIGETIVSVGQGNDPFSVTGGKVYLTEKIAGSPSDAPFGLSIVNPAQAGPFDLQEGRPVVIRATIEVNPTTAALTVTTTNDGGGGGLGGIPNIIDGIPLQIKHVNVNITRSGFTFNPTSCNPAQVEGTIDSAEGASASVKVPFQVTNCQALKFTPKFAVSTQGKTSKADGASLTAKLTEPSEVQGSQANIAKVKVELPKSLPSRLTTLQKACTNAQFEANPAGCPSESKIGYATVNTPLLPVPLTGPAIFVSHGGEAFPSLTMVLQGYGVKIDLVGTTYISKAGITSTTFKTVPDVPFSTFELTLPEGKYSALAANGNLCTQKLTMPTEFIAQNGTPIYETTALGVTGCAKVKALTRAQKLQKALKACRKDKGKAKRAKCEAKARKQYGPVKNTKKKGKKK
jgi:hypothetical protein